jgi:glucosylceramidase
VKLGSWSRAEEYALDIIEDLNHWTAGWIDWNLALNLQGGPNWSKNFVDAPIIVNASAKEYYRQPSFYILSHFSKFLAPGSVRVTHEQKTSSWIDRLRTDVHSVVLRNPDQQNVLIAVNSKDAAVEVNVHAQSNMHFKMELPAKSIATFVWKATK